MTQSDYFVVEADEYGVHPPKDKTPKLLFLHPTVALCLNIDFDHPDVYASIEETKKTFLQFFSQATTVVLCGDDPQIQSVLPQIKKEVVVYGTGAACDYRIVHSHTTTAGISFEITHQSSSLGVFSTALFGEKNILNTAGAITTLLTLGMPPEAVRHAITDFAGAKRRMEMVWTDGSSTLLDDYGHHPAEIRATVAALRTRFPGKRLHVIFQPHTFSRTQTLKHEFVEALSEADQVYLLPIFASARERPAAFTVTSDELARLVSPASQARFVAVANEGALLPALSEALQPGDVVLTLGAGDVYKLKSGIIRVLNEKHT
jgi:UDP-N-acetylmuramate--alanine ligase